MKLSRALAASALTLLALPAAASAHPGVYSVTQLTRPAGQTCTIPDTSCLTSKTQYNVANDGWDYGFTEDNDVAPGANRGMINYKAMPGGTDGWRGGPEKRLDWLAYAPAQTNLQAHAICTGVTALEDPNNILAWQEDPFFNYIPWQATTANLGDVPSEWIPLVKNLTGVDLATLTGTQFQSECTRIGGTYHKADTGASLTGALETAVKAPLQSQITTLQTSMTSLQAAKTAVETQLAAARAVTPAAPRPLTLTLSGKRFNPAVAMITGEAGSKIAVHMTIGDNDAKRRRISLIVSTRNVTLGSTGAALVNLGLTSKAKKALKNRSIAVTVDATGPGGTKTAGGVYVG
jgi:hypothetical protein